MKPVVVLVVILFAGCATMMQRAPRDTVWQARTEHGKAFRARHLGHLTALSREIRKSVNGLGDTETGFSLEPGDSTVFYVGISVGTYDRYNILKTNFEERAATAVTERIAPMLGVILRQKELMTDSLVSGVFVSIAWQALDFSYRFDSGDQEAVQFYTKTAVAREFVNYKITNKELLARSIVVGYKNGASTGRIQFDVNKNF